jgi:hypothetical protein
VTAQQDYRFGPSEQPLFPGSPYSPAHHPVRRLSFIATMLVVGLAAQLGHSLVLVNLATIGGSLGVGPSGAIWLPSIYVAINATANLLLVRGRMEFGIPAVAQGLLALHVGVTLVQLAVPSFEMALVVRAVSGAVSASLVTMTIYFALQIVPPQQRPQAILIGVSITQLSAPLARLIPVDLLAIGAWRGLHLFDLAITLVTILALAVTRLPPSVREKAFEPLDFVTCGLVMPAMILGCGALGAGRYLWWTDTGWIGLALCAAILLLAAAIAIEHNRARPMLLTNWLGSKDILRFAVIALLVRFALAEQTYGAVGLLTLGGLNNDQLHSLFLIVFAASVAGVVTAVTTFRPETVLAQIMVAAFVIAIGAWLDTGSNSLTRPEQLYVSQAFLGFGACLFIGPALLYGFGRVLQLGPNYLISFLVIFSVSQNVGGLLGASLLGTYQVERAKAHALALSEHLVAADPLVAARLAQQGPAALFGAVQREANLLAFNDVFFLVACLAALIGVYMAKAVIAPAVRSRLPMKRTLP